MSAPFRLSYRRKAWDYRTAPRIKRFDSREDVTAFLERLLAHGGPVQARLQVKRDGAWVEIPLGPGVTP